MNEIIKSIEAEQLKSEIPADFFMPKDPLYQLFTANKGDLTFLYFHYPAAFPCR